MHFSSTVYAFLTTYTETNQYNTQYIMTNSFHATIPIHPHHMGHVIGKEGSNIRRIRKQCNVVTFNPPYGEHQKEHVKLTIEGNTRNDVQQAIFQIDHQIAISSAWCRNNGMEYQ